MDQACALLRARGFRHFAIDAGGDLFATGRQGDGTPWSVGVSDPQQPARNLAALTLDGQAIATSTIARRRWRAGGESRHHLIDQRTGRPATSGVASVTVSARTVTQAETLAKAALVLGPVMGRALLNRHQAAGLFVLESGDLVYAGPPVFVETV